MEEWKEYRLGEIVDLVIDYRGKTPLKLGGEWTSSGYRALSAKNIKTGRIVNEDSIRYVDEDLYKKWMKDEVQRGDILITSEAPFGQIYYWDSDEKIVLSQRLFCVRISSSTCSKFVYHYMTTAEFQAELDGRATGTTVVGLRQPELLKCKISLPSLPTQQKIANILSSLDDKIEVNRRINEQLEELAQALFKSWFVDFEPFKDGDFVESELGMIPKGWKVCELSDILYISKDSINPSKTPDNLFHHYSIPAYDNSKREEVQEGKAIMSNKFKVTNKTTLFSKLNPRIKRVWFIDNVKENAICSTEFVPYKAKNNELTYYVNGLINSVLFYNQALSIVNGATGSHQRFHPQDTLKFNIAFNESVANEYSTIVEPVVSKILVNQQEIRHLTTLRDTLLPKLMSGEIDVNEVEI